ncbi:MAG: KilA-N domain-containing protein [Verrucomicrobiota bacterium]
MHERQMLLSLISHEVDGLDIPQRVTDGYINATALCQASGKQFNDYFRLKNTQAFLEELSTETGIPVSEMVVISKGGNVRTQGTWIHPDIAVNLGQWCSPKFAVLVSKWVREWMSGKLPGGNLPYHIRRYMANRSAIPPTHFSILNELIFGLIAPMEQSGYTLPENMLPDISEGRMFAKWLREEKGVDTDTMPTYRHVYEDGRAVFPKMYPISLLGEFRGHFYDLWIPKRAAGYFAERDPNALPHLDVLLLEYQEQPAINA